jgi:hypothetical protein
MEKNSKHGGRRVFCMGVLVKLHPVCMGREGEAIFLETSMPITNCAVSKKLDPLAAPQLGQTCDGGGVPRLPGCKGGRGWLDG